jgi:cold shock CspA family protein
MKRARATATIQRVVADRGFAFAHSEDLPNIFVHASDFNGGGSNFNGLQPGDVIEFDPLMGDKGPRATKVSVIQYAEDQV